jgi:hypothetical protein
VSNKIPEGVPNPVATFKKATGAAKVDQIVDMAGNCLNAALEAARNEPQQVNRVFSPQNWIKTKTCLAGIKAATQAYFAMLPNLTVYVRFGVVSSTVVSVCVFSNGRSGWLACDG